MNVEVLFFAQLREISNIRQKTYPMAEGATLNQLLDMIVADFGENFRTEVTHLEGLRVLIGDHEYSLEDGLGQTLHDKDTVVFLPPIAGG
jgi:molybdopterin converting factor small subunit